MNYFRALIEKTNLLLEKLNEKGASTLPELQCNLGYKEILSSKLTLYSDGARY
ncbi:Hypothetical protein P9303_22821 [Prochlorococcus marinus str. MIT 9303]|uniref:Uncharacterized protein n=1 Tax=Prochlorococcus marinus (strain MIT 9303) TaxID=59922 RepID=A2CC07_PROM3|nr:Hypothetical protein P9303_22821 [Prochlorococcus marinus str. MIT 9303]